jgi:hypothetical protein
VNIKMAFEDLRHEVGLYAARVVQFLFALVILAVAGSDVSTWTSSDCNSPGKLNYNVAVVCKSTNFLANVDRA